MPSGLDHSQIWVAAKVVSLLDSREGTKFGRTIIKLPDRVLPPALVFGDREQGKIPFYLQECKVSCTAGFSAPLHGLMLRPTSLRSGEDRVHWISSPNLLGIPVVLQ